MPTTTTMSDESDVAFLITAEPTAAPTTHHPPAPTSWQAITHMFSFAIGPSVSPGQDGSCEDGPRGHSHLATQLRARHVLQHPIRGQQASNKFSRHCIAIYQEWIFDSRHAKAKPLTKAGLDVSCLGEGETFVKVLHGYCLYPMQPPSGPK